MLGRTDRAQEERNKDAARTRTEKRWGKRTLPLDAAGESINPFASDNSNLSSILFSTTFVSPSAFSSIPAIGTLIVAVLQR